MCWLCWRRRLAVVVPLLALTVGVAWVVWLVVWWRPAVACGIRWDPASGQMATLYCRATGPVWP